MTASPAARTGGQILIDQLRIHGVDRVFCVPGESYLAALDALHDVGDEIALVVCRQEGGAAYMAEAYGKPGICFVTRGPGATNASVGLHTAFQDSTPLILFIGQVARDQVEREAFQEVDYRRFFGEMTKWAAQIDDASRIPELVGDADLLLVVGARLGEMTTGGYSLIDLPVPKQVLVHVHPGAEELGRVYHATLPINAGPVAFGRAAAKLEPVASPAWSRWTAEAHADTLANLEYEAIPGAVQMGEVMTWLRGHLSPDAIITTGAGNYSAWAHRFYQYRRFRTQLGPTSGSMGYGTPAAIAAKLVHPERTVVAFAGDGCFLMNGQEIATAIHYGANIVILVINNGMYGTIRMHQERTYPGRVSGTTLTNPDFAALARSYGAHGEVVETTAQFEGAFLRAEASGRPALIEIRIDSEALSPRMSLSQMREAAQERLASR